MNSSFINFADVAWNNAKGKISRRSWSLADGKDNQGAHRIKGHITARIGTKESEGSDWEEKSGSALSTSTFCNQPFSDTIPDLESCAQEDPWNQDDFIFLKGKKEATASFSKVDTEMHAMGIKTKEVFLKNDNHWIEVVGKGTKFMKTLHFPTVIVKLLKGNLEKSKIHYIMLELETGELTGDIPAVMFSSPYAHGKTEFAELLPLSGQISKSGASLKPLLRSKIYRRIFRTGNSFKVKSLIPGRVFDGSAKYEWNMYDLRNTESYNRVIGLIHMDISAMSRTMIKVLKPPIIRTRSEPLRRKEKKHSLQSNDSKLLNSNTRFQIANKRESKFTKYFIAEPSNAQVSKDLLCDCENAFQMDTLYHPDGFDKYL